MYIYIYLHTYVVLFHRTQNFYAHAFTDKYLYTNVDLLFVCVGKELSLA